MTGIVEPAGATPASPGSDPDLSPQHAWKELAAKAVASRAAHAEAAAKAASGASPGPTPLAGSDLMAQLLRAWTIDNARAAGRESEVGSLEVGKRADILVLDRHPYFTPAETLGETRAVVIVSGGKVIRDELAARPRG
jgi:predicted amidohydrolase YtcJ